MADLADGGILFPAVPAEIPIPADLAGILFPADLAELVTVGVADVAVAGVATLAVPDVFAGPELVAMIVADEEVETVDGIPIYYGGDYDDSDYEDPRDEVETVDGIPVYSGGDFDDSDYEDPRDIFYEEWVDWCDFNAPDGYYGFFPDDGEAQLPVSNCASMTAVEDGYDGSRIRGVHLSLQRILTPGR